MDMTSPLMIVAYIIASIIAIALGLVGWNVRANRRRRAKLVDAMQRSRFGRTK